MVPAWGLSVAFAAVDELLLLLLPPQPASAAATAAITAAAMKSRRGLKDRWSAPPAQAEANLWPAVSRPRSALVRSPSSMLDTVLLWVVHQKGPSVGRICRAVRGNQASVR